jgi:hypothetical protein
MLAPFSYYTSIIANWELLVNRFMLGQTSGPFRGKPHDMREAGQM